MTETSPPDRGDIIHLIERLDAFEERCGVVFESLNALSAIDAWGRDKIQISGEVHARDGLTIACKLYVVVTAYDQKGRVLTTTEELQSRIADPEFFYGFEAFCIQIAIDFSKVAKIRLYPSQREY